VIMFPSLSSLSPTFIVYIFSRCFFSLGNGRSTSEFLQ
jgi:hypothetical protein